MTEVLKKEYFCISDDKLIDAINFLRNSDLSDEYKELFSYIALNHRHILLSLLNGTLKGTELEKEVKKLGKDFVQPKNKKEATEEDVNAPSASDLVQEILEKDLLDLESANKSNVNNTSSENSSDKEDNGKSSEIGKLKPKKDKKKKKQKKKKPGKRGHNSFANAEEKKHIFDPDFIKQNYCPCCNFNDGLYTITPSITVLFSGSSPISSEVNITEKLRCFSCGVTIVAQVPIEVENSVGRFLPSAVAQFAIMRFSLGFPHHRMEILTNLYGLHIPDANQWRAIEAVATDMEELLFCLTINAANAKWVGIDDAYARVIDLKKDIQGEIKNAKTEKESKTGIEAIINENDFRTGIQSTVFIAKTFSGHTIALYMTGRNHQGENKAALLELRTNPEPIILMSDAAYKALMKISTSNDLVTLETNCLEHYRINLEEIRKNYPKETGYILNELSKVYKNEKHCKDECLDDFQRLNYHQTYSANIMDEIKKFIEKELKENPRAEPNGEYARKALKYAVRHWERLTGFLKYPGAEIDNNSTERGTKPVVRYRENSKKYLTEHGASIGDFYMSLIETCKLNNVNPLEYLTFCITYRKFIQDDPELFLPWNYLETKKELEEELKNRPRYRIVSQRGTYIPKEENFRTQ